MKNLPSHNEERICKQCSKSFIAYRYNSSYCSKECSTKSNNELALANYYIRKENKRNPKRRVCLTPDCGTVLSRYNKKRICEPCQRKQFIIKLTDWGYSYEEAEEHWLIL